MPLLLFFTLTKSLPLVTPPKAVTRPKVVTRPQASLRAQRGARLAVFELCD